MVLYYFTIYLVSCKYKYNRVSETRMLYCVMYFYICKAIPVAAFLSITSADVSNLIASGEFDAFGTKIGDSYVFSKVALEGWMNGKISGR